MSKLSSKTPDDLVQLEPLNDELQKMLRFYFQALSHVDFSQISEEKKASMGLSLLEKLLKGPHV